MGLTIHYKLRTSLTKPADVRELTEALRQYARDLPFKEVGELLEFEGKDADSDEGDREEEDRWFKIQAGAYVTEDDGHYSVKPTHIIGFTTWPGEGCESANIGFCRYPATIEVPTESGRTHRVATKLSGWRWSSFCKTQYASNPKYGGTRHFLQCHLCVVKLLDCIQRTKLVTVEVHDEGDYWEHRDVRKLADEVGSWNEMIAGFSGLLKDMAGEQGAAVESAIADFPTFEHLEAKGLDKIEKLRKRSRPETD